jgi:hypothetical protein
MKTHSQIDKRSLAMMEAIIIKIENDPQKSGLEKARSLSARWLRMHNNRYINKWHTILRGDWPDIKKILLDDTGAA